MRAPGLAALALCLSLAACTSTVSGYADKAGSSADAPASEPASAPAADCSRDAFTFTPPDGWTDVSDQVPAVVVAYADTQTTGSFAANVNVTCEPSKGLSTQQYADGNEITEEKLFKVTVEDRHETTLAGEPAVRWRLQHDHGSPVLIELNQVLIVHDGKGWVISVSVAATDAAAAAGYVDAVVGSWQWA